MAKFMKNKLEFNCIILVQSISPNTMCYVTFKKKKINCKYIKKKIEVKCKLHST